MLSITDFPVQKIRIGDIQPHPRNREIYGDIDKGVQKLAYSIEAVGILHEPIVSHRESGEYVMLSGHRRLQGLLASGKRLDDTIDCRVVTGLSYPEEESILINANWPSRSKSRNVSLSERHALLRLWHESGKLMDRNRSLIGFCPPKTLKDVAEKTRLSRSFVKRISSLWGQIQRCPAPTVKMDAEALFEKGRYQKAKKLLRDYWDHIPDDSNAERKFKFEPLETSLGAKKTDGKLILQYELTISEQKLKIAALEERVQFLEKRIAELRATSREVDLTQAAPACSPA